MKILGFCAGAVRTQRIDGEDVRTAYVKSPVPPPWVVTATGAQGDQVAVHTNHLYAIDRLSYDHWGYPDAEDGLFAENLTLDELDQSALRVGDRFRLGTAVVVVTGPRIPCWKLTWRLGRPKTFQREFRLSGRSGVYLDVVTPGVVEPGDPLVPVSGDPGAPTVAELARLCDSGPSITPADRDVIDRALARPDLSDGVRGTLTLKLANHERDSATDGWRGWRRFSVDEVVPESPDVNSYVLRPVDAGPLAGFRAGQHVVVRIGDVVRTWSLSRYGTDHYRITVKHRGAGSAALASASTVELRSPAGRFHLDRGSFRPVVLVASGIGITPMIAMIQAHLDRNGFVPPLWLLYRTRAERTAFGAYLDALFARHEHLHLRYFSAPLTAERVVDVMRDNYLPGAGDVPWFESDVYVCGSLAFTTEVRAGLIALGANPDLVFAEDFVAAAAAPAGPSRRTDAVVRFGDRETVWSASAEQTLLELAEAAGLDRPYDCRAGTCRTCEARVLDGAVEGPVVGDRALLCTSYPLTDRVVVE
ncbi:MOSC domain-containing protein [Cryptosporangium japonicum]|uniref:MOSC and FAD-binding oxidoreductase domain-containing protein n=1 Tax=Cryptosporangium japonicum TaxID=80872 RepID=A0ABN0U5T2_9ACTN